MEQNKAWKRGGSTEEKDGAKSFMQSQAFRVGAGQASQCHKSGALKGVRKPTQEQDIPEKGTVSTEPLSKGMLAMEGSDW